MVAGLILAGSVIIYLLIQETLSRNGLKELYVAVIYSIGILIAPFLLSGVLNWFILLNLILLSFLNLVLFSWFERAEDQADSFHSIATVYTGNGLVKFLYCLLGIGVAQFFLADYSAITSYFLIGFLTYAFLLLRSRWARVHHRYRTIGDGVFLLPILYEWL